MLSHCFASQPWDIQRWTYRQFLARCDFAKGWLIRQGVKPDDAEPAMYYEAKPLHPGVQSLWR